VDLEALRAFLAVVETGSFLGAATALDYPRATLRRRVDELEVRAGTALLVRTPSGVSPTEAGRALATHGRVILDEAKALLSAVREVGAEPAGDLRLVLPVGLPPQLLVPLCRALHRRYPRLRVHLCFADDPVRGLLGDVDVALHWGRRGPVGPWVSHEIARVREWLVASPTYLRAHGTPSRVEQLRDHTLLAWEAPGADPARWPTRHGAEVPVAPVLTSSDVHLLRRCAAKGMGIAFVPDARLPAEEAEPLVPVLAAQIRRITPIHVVVPAALADIPRVRAVLAEVRRIFGARAPTAGGT
jgi:DNA-binding transcriptional LysR family regulator